MKKKVVVGMSGGVDSSVAALLLRDAGHDVVGVTMRIYSGRPAAGPIIDSCYGPGENDDIAQAADICARLGIPHRVVDLRDEYKSLVLDYTREEYLSGRTPNPCILCNRRVKFGLLLDRASEEAGIRFDAFATGHYCRVMVRDDGRVALRRASADVKDQSYFLCMLTQEQLRRVMFPLGELSKPQVREIARKAGFSNHDRRESQDFVAGGYRSVVSAPEKEGPITDPDGNVIGTHKGVWGYTIGQRKGLGVGGGDPLYVTEIHAATNTVVAGPEQKLYRGDLTVHDANWSAIDPPSAPVRLDVKIRYRNPPAPATVTALPDGSVSVVFDEPQRAITRGQWAVFYQEDVLLGGGPIS